MLSLQTLRLRFRKPASTDLITPIPASKQNDVEEVERLDVDNIQDNVQQTA